MQIAIVSGSHRKNSQSIKVAQFIANDLKKTHPAVETVIIDLADNPFPLWNEQFATISKDPQSAWHKTSLILKNSDAFVVVTPEWGGMVPSGLKNFLLLCSSQELADKPGLITSVSAGSGGAYPIAELRMSGYKNNFICWIPHHVIIRSVEKVLNPGPAISVEDSYLRERLQHTIALLIEYGKALRLVRESKLSNFDKYPNGMS